MRRRSRTRRVLKWVGTVVCVLLGGLWLFSCSYAISWSRPLGNDKYEFCLSLADGIIEANLFTLYDVLLSDLASREVERESGWRIVPVKFGPYRSTRPRVRWRSSEAQYKTKTGRYIVCGFFRSLEVAIWIPLLLAAIPTAFLWVIPVAPTVYVWLRDRRRIPPGHCQNCGYNLTGNVSGRCSECGTAIEREAKPA